MLHSEGIPLSRLVSPRKQLLVVEIFKEHTSLGSRICVFSIEQLDVIFPWNLLRIPNYMDSQPIAILFSLRLSNSLFEETDFSMGMNTAKCNKTSRVTFNSLSVSKWLQAPLLLLRWMKGAWTKPASGHSSGALVGLLPNSYSVSHSLVCSQAPSKNSAVWGWVGRILPKLGVGGMGPVTSATWLGSCRLIPLLGWLSRSQQQASLKMRVGQILNPQNVFCIPNVTTQTYS